MIAEGLSAEGNSMVRIGMTSVACLAAGAVAIGVSASVAQAEETGEKTEKKEAFGRLSVDEVEKLVGTGDVSVFDNNSESRYAKGHVPTAKWVRYDEVKPADLPAAKDRTLVFYCGSETCGACHTAAASALKLGYTKVYIMPAGIAGWEKAKKKVERAA